MNKNKSEIAPLIGEILDLLRFDEDFNNADHLRGITNVAKAHLIHFLKDQGKPFLKSTFIYDLFDLLFNYVILNNKPRTF